ncbi:MAG: tricorn protease [Planctomycetota bacterium]|jgi:tricorn protease
MGTSMAATALCPFWPPFGEMGSLFRRNDIRRCQKTRFWPCSRPQLPFDQDRRKTLRLFRALLLVLLAPLMAHAQESAAIQLARDAAVSPNGDRIAFVWRNDIWTSGITGGQAQRLTQHASSDRAPEFSPDGTQIAFISNRDGSNQIYVVAANGGAPKRMTKHTEGYDLVEWTADGSGFLVRANRDHFWRNGNRFFIQHLDGTKTPEILFDAYGHSGSLSPDNNSFLYCRERASTYRKRYVGSESEQIWHFDRSSGEHKIILKEKTFNRHPLWDADGTGFYYVSERDGSYNLWHHHLKTRTKRQLTTYKSDGPMFPAISRDGKTLVYRRLADLYHFDVATGEAKKISLIDQGDPTIDPIQNIVHESATSATFTPDGRVMAFTAGNDIWVMDTVLKEAVQVTTSASEEASPLFVNNDVLMFISHDGGNADIWTATRTDPKKYFWQNKTFQLKRLTQTPNVESDLRLLPDGKRISFTRDRGDLFIMDMDGSNSRQLLSSWNAPDYDFSADCTWLAYAVADNDFNGDIWIKKVDGKGEPFNLSCHPDNDSNPRFSPDGKVLAFTGRRWGTESDIAYVYLTKDSAEETSRDRTLEKALKKMKERKKGKKKAAEKSKPAKTMAKADKQAKMKKSPTTKPVAKKDDTKKKSPASKVKAVSIDFEGIRDRIRRIRNPNSGERGLTFWPTGAKLLFSASVGGKSGVYSVEFPDKLRPKLFASQGARNFRAISEAKKLVGVMAGKPAIISSTGKSESFSFTANQAVHLGELSSAVFRQGWMLMRDNFYDGKLGNNNWDDIYRKYAPMAAQCLDATTLGEVGNMMLGELNGSHLGFRIRSLPSEQSVTRKTWNTSTGHLGCRFDPAWQGPGLKIADVIRKTPAAMKGSRLKTGEIIISIDGHNVDPGLEIATVMTGVANRTVILLVKGTDGKDREVLIRPTSYRAVRAQLYEEWLEDNRNMVDRLSKGKLGYLHIKAMSGGNLLRFDEELYRIGHGKEGLIIDVRENGGGSITDHLLTSLTQPTHAITKPRGGGEGYPADRRIYATWDKPIIVLCNQNSFSNAEIFAHAVKTLKRGRVVGVQTAGGVISTGGRSIMGLGFVRMPFRGWYLMDGEDMELNGCKPHAEIWPAPGDWPAGIDTQMDKAVEMLMEDVKAWQSRPRPRLRKSSER